MNGWFLFFGRLKRSDSPQFSQILAGRRDRFNRPCWQRQRDAAANYPATDLAFLLGINGAVRRFY